MSALDANIRLTLQKELKALQKRTHTTMCYVTHDVEEAYLLSDRIMIIDQGVIQQLDTPTNIFRNPANDFVREFVNGHILDKMESLESVVPHV